MLSAQGTEVLFVGSTHVKASANLKKQARKAVPKEVKRYTYDLNRDREAHEKKPFEEDDGDDSRKPEMGEKTVSTTGPECGVFRKGEHKGIRSQSACGLRPAQLCDKHTCHTRKHS